jgi:broad specificity phosphatase PhoE
MTKIILTRHGHVDWISPERYRGRAELFLSDLGRQQIQSVGHQIASKWQMRFLLNLYQRRLMD